MCSNTSNFSPDHTLYDCKIPIKISCICRPEESHHVFQIRCIGVLPYVTRLRVIRFTPNNGTNYPSNRSIGSSAPRRFHYASVVLSVVFLIGRHTHRCKHEILECSKLTPLSYFSFAHGSLGHMRGREIEEAVDCRDSSDFFLGNSMNAERLMLSLEKMGRPF